MFAYMQIHVLYCICKIKFTYISNDNHDNHANNHSAIDFNVWSYNCKGLKSSGDYILTSVISFACVKTGSRHMNVTLLALILRLVPVVVCGLI